MGGGGEGLCADAPTLCDGPGVRSRGPGAARSTVYVVSDFIFTTCSCPSLNIPEFVVLLKRNYFIVCLRKHKAC